ncbi:MAG TPA: penicillin-binding transpeptidase domain-containing protein [Bacilli bacterium]|jgi:stage V sporulation protein D (sporulation-specific penicillin-binding protein)|nr:penicillin-binding transpeptidase domain-containing protein [Bacilli bacterium]HPZ27779.1 penicillin-binding transpeptidase domain-containing protein [Bacilli bacterium]
MMKIVRNRIFILLYVFFIMFLIVALRVGYVQVVKGEIYIERAFRLWTRNIPVSNQRGKIFDRNGKLIVGNTLAPTVSIIPKQIKDKEYTLGKLASLLGVKKEDIAHHFKKNVSVEIIKPAGKNIDLETAKRIIAADLEGVYISSDVIRYYPYGNTLSHVLGIVGIDNQGITGVEYIYDNFLMGRPGSQNIYTDAHGNKYPDLTGTYTPPGSGFDLYLTIDIDMQLTLERVLDNAAALYDPVEVFGLVMDPKTSEILAMASRPNFDLINYQKYDQELFNRNLPIWKSFEPGSTFKIVTYSAGLEEKVFSLNERFYDPGFTVIDGARIRCWKAGGHGDQNFVEVIQNSCNPGFVSIGMRLGKEKLFSYIDAFGFGKKTGVDLLGESTGIVFNPEKIGNVEVATSAFGQGNTVTPLQLVNATNAAVNGGVLNTPYILKGFGIPGTNTLIFQQDTKFVRRVISEETSAVMRDVLERVVALGTARSAYIEGYRVGGKTGTAQIPIDGVYVPGKYILSFLGIAPMNDPRVSAYIAINQPKTSIQYGGVIVAPMLKEVLLDSLSLMDVEKQEGGIPRDPRWWVDKFLYTVDDYIGRNPKTIGFHPHYRIKIIGDGDVIIAQSPDPGEKIVQDGYVILYTN